MQMFAVFLLYPLLFYAAKFIEFFLVIISEKFFRSVVWKFIKVYFFSAIIGAGFFVFCPFETVWIYILFSILFGLLTYLIFGNMAYQNKKKAEYEMKPYATISYDREAKTFFFSIILVPVASFFNILYFDNLLFVLSYPTQFIARIMMDYPFMNFICIAGGIFFFLYMTPIVNLFFAVFLNSIFGKKSNLQ